jgi:hypothetical protein
MKASDYQKNQRKSDQTQAEVERDLIYDDLRKNPNFDFSKRRLKLLFSPVNLSQLNTLLAGDGWKVDKESFTEDYRSWSNYYLTII